MNKITETLLAASAFVLAVGLSFWAVFAVTGNTELSRRQNELDGKAYTACVTAGVWSPVECRAGEYGTR